MDEQPPEASPRSTRRALLGSAAAAAAAVTVGTFIRPGAVAAVTSGPMNWGTVMGAGVNATTLNGSTPQGSAVFLASHSEAGTGLMGRSLGVGGVGVYGVANQGYGLIGDTGLAGDGAGKVGVWGRDVDSAGQIGVAGSSSLGAGVAGYAEPGGAYALPPATGAPVGVHGASLTGTGVLAQSTSGVALKVSGKAAFSRSGRVRLATRTAFVDVDLRARGGLAGTPLCLANLMTRRAGVHVEAVRPNYPSAGFMRIYLNKVASTTSGTYIAWIVMG